MKLAIVHLSDIHFRSQSDLCFRRREKFSNTILFARAPEEQLVFVISGDIANKGAKNEYETAYEFFSPIFITLGITPNNVVLIPGNHDCNFDKIGDLRPRLLTEVESQLGTIWAFE